MKIKNKKNKKPRGSPESDPRRQSLVTAVGSKRPGSLGWAAASPPLPARLIGVRRLRSEDGGEGGSWWSSTLLSWSHGCRVCAF